MALIPPGYLDAVVSLGTLARSFDHNGTGFLYAHPLPKQGDRTPYRFFLVTNRHVAETPVTHIRFNHPAKGLTVEPMDAVVSGGWIFNTDGSDIAVAPLEPSSPVLEGRWTDAETVPGFFIGDVCTTLDEGVQPAEGDGVFLIGFPLGMVGEARNFPVVRYGAIARIQDWVQRQENTFLIDAPAFPGNSGGPVVLKPESVAISNTNAIRHCLLVGVISQQVRSREVAVSERTGEPRVVFLEDTGLAVVVPVEMVRDTAAKAVLGRAQEASGPPPRDTKDRVGG